MRGARARGMHEVVPPFSGGTTFLFRGMLWGLRQIFVQPFNAVGMHILDKAFRSHMNEDALSSFVMPVITQIHLRFLTSCLGLDMM